MLRLSSLPGWHSVASCPSSRRDTEIARLKGVAVTCGWRHNDFTGDVACELTQLCDTGQLHDALLWMDKQGQMLSGNLYWHLLQACIRNKALAEVKRVYAHLAHNGYGCDVFLGESSVKALLMCGGLQDAHQLFNRLSYRTAFSWNALISAYTKSGQAQEALRLYWKMQEGGMQPDKYTFVPLLKGCSNLADLEEGTRIHAQVVRYRFETDVYISTALIDMYVKCGSIVKARHVFDRMSQRSVVSWNAMLAGYSLRQEGDKAWHLYYKMQEEGLSPDDRTLVTMVKACASMAEMEEGVLLNGRRLKLVSLEKVKALHVESARRGYQSQVFVANSLISAYAKCGNLSDAQQLFETIVQPDVVSWNAMLAAYAQLGEGEQALRLYVDMLEKGVAPDDRTIVSMLQACGTIADKEEEVFVNGRTTKLFSLQKGKAFHAQAAVWGYTTDVFVGSTLVSMYAKCGAILDAQHVFDKLLKTDVITWNAMLAGYCRQAQPEKALLLYNQMQEEAVLPDVWTFVSALQACNSLADEEETLFIDGESIKVTSLQTGMAIHAVAAAATAGMDANSVVYYSALIGMYANCGGIHHARHVFDTSPRHGAPVWNAMFTGYVQQGQHENVLMLFLRMQKEDVKPDSCTFVSTLRACSSLAGKEESVLVEGRSMRLTSLERGKAIHAEAVVQGYGWDGLVGNTLVSMYTKCGSLTDAELVFNALSQRDVVSWNAMIAGYAQQAYGEKALECYSKMLKEGTGPNERTIVSVLQACGHLADMDESTSLDGLSIKVEWLQKVKELHAEAASQGFESDIFVGNTLVSIYAKCGSIALAHQLFDQLSQQNVVSWNALLAGYAHEGQAKEVLELYSVMQDQGLEPNERTFACVLKAFASLTNSDNGMQIGGRSVKVELLQKGKTIHSEAARRAYEDDLFVGNSLINLYAKCSSMEDAQYVFDRLSQRNVVSFNVLITGYAQQDQEGIALDLFAQLLDQGFSPDEGTFAGILQACSSLSEQEESTKIDGQAFKVEFLQREKTIHAEASRWGYNSDVSVAGRLINAYAKCGSVVDAQHAFDSLPLRNVVCWNAMIAAYAEQDQGDMVGLLFRQMESEGVRPDEFTFMGILKACSNTGALDMCVQIHRDIAAGGYTSSLALATALIHAYANCGSMVDAHGAFDAMPQHDVVSWNALITGYAQQGDTDMTVSCFLQMQRDGLQPDGITFVSLLSACSHAGRVDQGLEYFNLMTIEYNITPAIEHYASMLDLFSRAGLLSEAANLLLEMPMPPDWSMWLSLLGACCKHGDISLARLAFDSALELQPKEAAPYVLMTNIYAHAGLWESAKEVDELRRLSGAWKRPGHSWIEHEHEVHSFMVRDSRHRHSDRIYELLRNLNKELNNLSQM